MGGAQRRHPPPGYPNQHHDFIPDRGAGSCSGRAPSAVAHLGTRHADVREFGESRSPKQGQPNHPSPAWGAAPARSIPLRGRPGAPRPCLWSGHTHSPGLCSGSLKWLRGPGST